MERRTVKTLQAKQARARHAVKRSMMLGQRVGKKYTKTWKKRSRCRKTESRRTGRRGISRKKGGLRGASDKSQDDERKRQWTGLFHCDGDDKAASTGKIFGITRCFQDCCVGLEDAPTSWKIVNLVFLQKPDEIQEGTGGYRAIALT